MGVDHTSGTDTKTETTDRPPATENAYQPPPDRPGASGQPSRAESRAAARTPAETGSSDEERTAEKPEGPGQGETSTEGEPEDEPVRDADQRTPLGPRAESRAQARKTQDAETSDAELGDPPDQEPLPPDREPGAAAETDRFTGLPTRADLDPAGAGELTRERGEPLAPVNENQDLREPDPERDSDWKKLLRNTGNDAEDAIKTSDDVGDTTLKLTKHRPPTELRTGTRDNGPQVRDVDHSANIPSAAMGVVAAATVMYGLAQGLRTICNRILRRNNGGSDR